MKYQASKLRKLAASGAAGLALVQSLQAATVLTGVADEPNNNVPIQPGHGSNAPGTPDITLLWAPAEGPSSPRWETWQAWPNGDGSGINGRVYQLDYLVGDRVYNGTVDYTIAFTPSSATIAVALTSLTLNNYGGAGDITLDWSVTGSVSGLIGSDVGVVVIDDPGGTTLDLALGFQGLGGETLTLILTPTGGVGSYFAIDNLSFDQVAIPEPSGAVLAAAGLGALALRRRRK